MATMANKEKTTREILNKITGEIVPCKKLVVDNIVFPDWESLGLIGQIYKQVIKTKEQPDGYYYNENEWQVVLRILRGKIYMTKNQPDTYGWKKSKIQKFIDADNVKLVGLTTPEGIVELSKIINTIKKNEDKLIVADMFRKFNFDLILITSPEEDRRCVEITQKIYDSGVTQCVDSWVTPDDNGMAPATDLEVGDYLIIENKKGKDYVYCIRKAEFNDTHTLVQ